ncbi:hypothetical protein [Lacticaseibacillus nasuensis]|nr:hypothetical protein [Lacticaseibacillus nasuensis]
MRKVQPKRRGLLAWGIVLPVVWALLTTFVEARRIGMLGTLLTDIGNWLIAPLCVAVGLYYLMDWSQPEERDSSPQPTRQPAPQSEPTRQAPAPLKTTPIVTSSVVPTTSHSASAAAVTATSRQAAQAPAVPQSTTAPVTAPESESAPTTVADSASAQTPPERLNANLMAYFQTDESESATAPTSTPESAPTTASRLTRRQATPDSEAAPLPDVNVPTAAAGDIDASPIDKAIAIKFGFSSGTQQEVDDALNTARQQADSRMSRRDR